MISQHTNRHESKALLLWFSCSDLRMARCRQLGRELNAAGGPKTENCRNTIRILWFKAYHFDVSLEE